MEKSATMFYRTCLILLMVFEYGSACNIEVRNHSHLNIRYWAEFQSGTQHEGTLRPGEYSGKLSLACIYPGFHIYYPQHPGSHIVHIHIGYWSGGNPIFDVSAESGDVVLRERPGGGESVTQCKRQSIYGGDVRDC